MFREAVISTHLLGKGDIANTVVTRSFNFPVNIFLPNNNNSLPSDERAWLCWMGRWCWITGYMWGKAPPADATYIFKSFGCINEESCHLIRRNWLGLNHNCSCSAVTTAKSKGLVHQINQKDIRSVVGIALGNYPKEQSYSDSNGNICIPSHLELNDLVYLFECFTAPTPDLVITDKSLSNQSESWKKTRNQIVTWSQFFLNKYKIKPNIYVYIVFWGVSMRLEEL